MKDEDIIHKWVNGDLTAEELEIFKQRPEYDSLVELYKNTEDMVVPDFDSDQMLANILQTEKSNKPVISDGRRVFLQSWKKYAAAACVLFFAAWMFWPDKGKVIFDLAKGERTEGVLPDQSTFILNAESRLAYDANTWGEDRVLDLKGEAFFKVQKGVRFRVNTPSGIVQVLGTQFNVRSRGNTLEVKCKSGRVAVMKTDGTTLSELQANEALSLKAGKIEEEWFLGNGDAAGWSKGISSFRKVILGDVLDEIERQFDIQIDASQISTKEIISCNFQHKNLELALQTTLEPLLIKFEIKKDGSVRLYK